MTKLLSCNCMFSLSLLSHYSLVKCFQYALNKAFTTPHEHPNSLSQRELRTFIYQGYQSFFPKIHKEHFAFGMYLRRVTACRIEAFNTFIGACRHRYLCEINSNFPCVRINQDKTSSFIVIHFRQQRFDSPKISYSNVTLATATSRFTLITGGTKNDIT